MKDLEKCRDEIDEIDKELVRLFEKRMQLSVDVAKYKLSNNLPILNAKREDEVIEKNKRYLSNENLGEYFEKFMYELMNVSKELQDKFIKGEEL